MATQVYDIMTDADENPAIAAGDFVGGESTAQHQEDLIICGAGDFKQHVDVGVGVMSYLDGEDFNDLLRNIALQFAQDGMKVASVSLTPAGTINTDAYYK